MKTKRIFSVLLIAMMIALLAACTAAEAPAPAADDAESMEGEEITLTVWDYYARPSETAVMEQINSEFEAAHPGVTVDRVVKSWDEMKATVKLALSSDDGPDVAMVNQGRPDMGSMVEAGLLTDLTDYVAQYGWDDALSTGVVERNSFSDDGVDFGVGNLYGIPNTAEFVGVFYNKQKFADAGIEVPQSFAEFEAALETLKTAGEVPIAFGNLDAWPAIHTYSSIQGGLVDMDYLDNFVYGTNNVSFDIPENAAAAAKTQEWVANEYFTPGYEGIGYDDSLQLFINGEGAMMITGSWISGEIANADAMDQFGFFVMPGEVAGEPIVSVAGTSMAFGIRNGTEHADLAAEYIDALQSPAAAEMWVEAGVVPVRLSDVPAEGLFQEMVDAWSIMNETDKVGHYIDWATPTFYDTFVAALQELLAGQVTPEEFTAKAQADYAEFLGQ